MTSVEINNNNKMMNIESKRNDSEIENSMDLNQNIHKVENINLKTENNDLINIGESKVVGSDIDDNHKQKCEESEDPTFEQNFISNTDDMLKVEKIKDSSINEEDTESKLDENLVADDTEKVTSCKVIQHEESNEIEGVIKSCESNMEDIKTTTEETMVVMPSLNEPSIEGLNLEAKQNEKIEELKKHENYDFKNEEPKLNEPNSTIELSNVKELTEKPKMDEINDSKDDLGDSKVSTVNEKDSPLENQAVPLKAECCAEFEKPGQTYEELLSMDMTGFVPNFEPFECPICHANYEVDVGVVLRDCLHFFCKNCLVAHIENTEEPEVRCPAGPLCDGTLEDCEIRTLVPREVYNKHLDKSLRFAVLSATQHTVAEPVHVQTYHELLSMDMASFVPNTEPFDCMICLDTYEKGQGVMLRECLHVFCKGCLVRHIEASEEPEVKCPFVDGRNACFGIFQDCEIRTIATREIYEKHLTKSIRLAEGQMNDAFHCKTPNCPSWWICADCENEYECPVCHAVNCVDCKAIHDGQSCVDYQEYIREMRPESQTSVRYLNEKINTREAMSCPKCGTTIMKEDGCDGMQCTICKTEICWVTRGPRWGPGGKGDMSGGCRCKVNGRLCHPHCNNCH